MILNILGEKLKLINYQKKMIIHFLNKLKGKGNKNKLKGI